MEKQHEGRDEPCDAQSPSGGTRRPVQAKADEVVQFHNAVVSRLKRRDMSSLRSAPCYAGQTHPAGWVHRRFATARRVRPRPPERDLGSAWPRSTMSRRRTGYLSTTESGGEPFGLSVRTKAGANAAGRVPTLIRRAVGDRAAIRKLGHPTPARVYAGVDTKRGQPPNGERASNMGKES